MIKISLIALATIMFITCQENQPLLSRLVGYAKDTLTMEGTNGIIVILRDLDPVDRQDWRLRRDTTVTQDGVNGFFEFDSVCYGDQDFATYIIYGIDSTENAGYQTRQYHFTPAGLVDTAPSIWLVKR